MCTSELRDEIIAEVLVAHVGLPRRYAQWFVAQLDEVQRSFVTRAAVDGRRNLVRQMQMLVHQERVADRCFPENICGERRRTGRTSRTGRTGQARRTGGQQRTLFA